MTSEATPTRVLGGIVASIAVGLVIRTCILPLRDVVVVRKRQTPMLLSLLSRGSTKTSDGKEGSVPVTLTIWVDRGGILVGVLRVRTGLVPNKGRDSGLEKGPRPEFFNGLSHDENKRVGDDFLANNDVNNEVATIWYTLCIRRHHPEPGRLGTQGEVIPVLVKVSLAYRCHL